MRRICREIGARPSVCRAIGVATLVLVLASSPTLAAEGDIVAAHVEVTPAGATPFDQTGEGLALVPDLGGPGQPALAVGQPRADGAGFDRGAVELLFLAGDGSVSSSRRIEDTPSGDPNDAFATAGSDQFGESLASLGDFDGDGRVELAVGAPLRDTTAGVDSGAVWILDLEAGTGVPLSGLRIDSDTPGIAPGSLAFADQFGHAVASLGDWDGDGVGDLAVGARYDDEGGTNRGAIHVLYLNADGTIKSQTRIADSTGGFTGTLQDGAAFGTSIAVIDDQNGDGLDDLAVGAPASTGPGSVWILHMGAGCRLATPSCGVVGQSEITTGFPGLPTSLASGDLFGSSLAWMPAASALDFDRLAVGAAGATANDTGAVWLLDLSNGAINAAREIASEVGWDVVLASSDQLGAGVAALGDLDANGTGDLALGARGFSGSGRAFTALVSACPTLILRPVVYHNPNDEPQDPCGPVRLPDAPSLTLHLYLETGGVASVGPVCEAEGGGGTEVCAWDVRLLFEDGFTLQSFTPNLTPPAFVGISASDPVAMPNELRLNWLDLAGPRNGPIKLGTVVISDDGSGEGVVRVGPGSAAVGAALQLQTIGQRTIALPEPGRGVWIAGLIALTGLATRRVRPRAGARSRARATPSSPAPARFRPLLRIAVSTGALVALLTASESSALSIKTWIRVSEGEQHFVATSTQFTNLGSGLAAPGDIDADGTPDLVVGCCDTFNVGYAEGLFTVFLGDDGAPAAAQVPSPGVSIDLLARHLTAIPDRDGDGRADLLVGTPGPPANFSQTSEVSLLFLNRDGTTKPARVRIGDGLGGFPSGLLTPGNDFFGRSIAWLGDADGDGVTHEFAVGAPGDDTLAGPVDQGAVWIVSLDASNTVTKQQRLLRTDLGLPFSTSFGQALAALPDLDGNGTRDLAIGSSCSLGAAPGCVHVVFLAPDGLGGVQAIATTTLYDGLGGLPSPPTSNFRVSALAWVHDLGPGLGGVLAIGAQDVSPNGEVLMVHLRADGTAGGAYRIAQGAGVGETLTSSDADFGSAITAPGDLDGDEVVDLVIGAEQSTRASGGVGSVSEGAFFIALLIDSDFDGLDDELDNCPGGPGLAPELSYNPDQADADGDGVGDLCDVCPGTPDPLQGDADGDGEGDLCEPVVLSLQPTGTPATPAWDVSVACGAFAVVEANVAVIPPSGGAAPALALTCPAAPPGGVCATLDPGLSSVSGPGLVSPAGVRSDAFYLQLVGDGPGGTLCQPLDPPAKVGELTTGAIGGTSVAAAALSEEGVELPGFGRALAADALGPIPITEVELVTGDPLPRVAIELGPAVVDGGLTRWDVLLTNANDRFHRVAFGLVAPFGTTTADMRFVGCDGVTAEPGEVRTCGAGVGATVQAAQSWTVGPVAPAQTPAGLREHTLYVVAEGRVPLGLFPPYLNLPDQTVVLGTLELTGTPDLEPALTLEGVDQIADRFGAGAIVPYERSVTGALADLDEVRLVGQFNPAEDEDGDGVQDLGDNCPFRANVDQADDGGFLSTDPDAKGNACQCGDGSGDGVVQDAATPALDDLTQVRDFLSGRITNPVIAADVEAVCSVAGTPECNIRDLVFLQRAIDLATPSETRCDASLAPAP